MRLPTPKSFSEGVINRVADINTTWFDAVVKRPLKGFIISLINQYPTPSLEQLSTNNGKVWLKIKEEYLKHEIVDDTRSMIESMFNVVIGEYENEPAYEQRIDWLVNELFKAVHCGEYTLRYPPGEYCWRSGKDYTEWIDALKSGSKALKHGQNCTACGGETKHLYLIQSSPDIGIVQCHDCHEDYIVPYTEDKDRY